MVNGAAFPKNAAPFHTRIDYAFCHPQGERPHPSAGSVPIFYTMALQGRLAGGL